MHPSKIAAEEMVSGMRVESGIGKESGFPWYEVRVMNIEKGMSGVKAVCRNRWMPRKKGTRLGRACVKQG